MHAELFRLKNGRTKWDSRTVVMVDEAAMLDSRGHRRIAGGSPAGGRQGDPRR